MTPNILLVDDSRTVRAVIRRALGMAGVDSEFVYSAGNGVQALEMLRSTKIDLVLSDIHMPEMDGVELIRQIRADDALAELPIVVISSDGTSQRVAQLNELGVERVLSKPFRPESIKDILESFGRGAA